MQHKHAAKQKQGFKQSFEGLPDAPDANAGLSAFNGARRGEPNCQELLDSRRSRSLTRPRPEKAAAAGGADSAPAPSRQVVRGVLTKEISNESTRSPKLAGGSYSCAHLVKNTRACAGILTPYMCLSGNYVSGGRLGCS